jgi:hypothetical protein
MNLAVKERISSDVLAGSLPGNAYVAGLFIRRTFCELSGAAAARIPDHISQGTIAAASGLMPPQSHSRRARLPCTWPERHLTYKLGD